MGGSTVNSRTPSNHRAETVGFSNSSLGRCRSRSRSPAATLSVTAAASAEAEADAEGKANAEAETLVHPVDDATADAADANDDSQQLRCVDASSAGRSNPPCGSSADGRASSSAWSYDSFEEEDREASEEDFNPHSVMIEMHHQQQLPMSAIFIY